MCHSNRNLRPGPAQERQKMPSGSRIRENDRSPVQRHPGVDTRRPPTVPRISVPGQYPAQEEHLGRSPRDALGLRDAPNPKQRRISARNPGYPAPWNTFDKERTSGFRCARANSKARFAQMHRARLMRLMPHPIDWVPYPETTRSAFSPSSARSRLANTRLLAENHLEDYDTGNRVHRQDIERDHAGRRPHALRGSPATSSPGRRPGRSRLPGMQELVAIVDLDQLVCGAASDTRSPPPAARRSVTCSLIQALDFALRFIKTVPALDIGQRARWKQLPGRPHIQPVHLQCAR